MALTTKDITDRLNKAADDWVKAMIRTDPDIGRKESHFVQSGDYASEMSLPLLRAREDLVERVQQAQK